MGVGVSGKIDERLEIGLPDDPVLLRKMIWFQKEWNRSAEMVGPMERKLARLMGTTNETNNEKGEGDLI